MYKINGNLIIDRTRFDTIYGFGSIEKVDSDIFIDDNYFLKFSESFGPVNSVRNLIIDDNRYLNDLSSLSNLQSTGYLYVGENHSLKDLRGLNNLRNVDILLIDENESLENLDGLENLESIVDHLHIVNNPSLESIESLESLKIEEIDEVSICINHRLSLCCIDDFVERISGPNSTLIWSNAPGCDTVFDILEDCTPVSVSEYPYESTLFLSPNPVSETLLVNSIKSFNYEIVNMQGKINEKGKSLTGEIHVEHLIPAVYVCHVTSEIGRYSLKFVKQ